jgi:hypothetical protein
VDSTLPVLLISAYDGSDVEDMAKEAGANGFVSGYAWGPGMKARLLALEAARRPNG